MKAAIGKIISATFDLALAAVFFITWTNPGSSLARPVEFMVLLMLIEFITVHSSAMLGSTWAGEESRSVRLRTVGVMTGLYALLVGAFSAGFGTWVPFIGFWVLSANRLLSMLIDGKPGPEAKKEAERSWARSVALYLFGAFGTTFLPVPRLGLTLDAMTDIDVAGSGVWVEEPWRVLAFGTAYFGIGGLLLLKDAVRQIGAPTTTEAAATDAAA
ncbi:MAG: hypothetical protein HKN91_13890 [Acidimicrobiia bacterium]|nr:hypothetical protein [Acidimicrobiia bacterium]